MAHEDRLLDKLKRVIAKDPLTLMDRIRKTTKRREEANTKLGKEWSEENHREWAAAKKSHEDAVMAGKDYVERRKKELRRRSN